MAGIQESKETVKVPKAPTFHEHHRGPPNALGDNGDDSLGAADYQR
jgi:hypothetical protein